MELEGQCIFRSSPHDPNAHRSWFENNCSSRSVSSAYLPINPQIHCREDLPWCGPSRYISHLPHHSLPLPGSQAPSHPPTGTMPISPFYLCVCTCYTFCLNAISPVSSHSSSLHKSTVPLRSIHGALWKAPFLPKADCRLLCFHDDWKAGTTPLYSSTPRTMYVQKHLLMNEWIGNDSCLSFWGSEPWWRARKLEGILQI